MKTQPDNTNDDPIERYFDRLYEGGWVGVECLLTKSQIEAASVDFVNGLFLATALACLEDDHHNDRPDTVAMRDLLYAQFGGLQGVIGELVKRLDLGWLYVAMDKRTDDDWVSPDLSRMTVH